MPPAWKMPTQKSKKEASAMSEVVLSRPVDSVPVEPEARRCYYREG